MFSDGEVGESRANGAGGVEEARTAMTRAQRNTSSGQVKQERVYLIPMDSLKYVLMREEHGVH